MPCARFKKRAASKSSWCPTPTSIRPSTASAAYATTRRRWATTHSPAIAWRLLPKYPIQPCRRASRSCRWLLWRPSCRLQPHPCPRRASRWLQQSRRWCRHPCPRCGNASSAWWSVTNRSPWQRRPPAPNVARPRVAARVATNGADRVAVAVDVAAVVAVTVARAMSAATHRPASAVPTRLAKRRRRRLQPAVTTQTTTVVVVVAGVGAEADAMARRVRVDGTAGLARAPRVRPANRESRVHRATKRRVRRLPPAIRWLHRSAQPMLKRKIHALRAVSSAAHVVAAVAAGGVVRVTAMLQWAAS